MRAGRRPSTDLHSRCLQHTCYVAQGRTNKIRSRLGAGPWTFVSQDLTAHTSDLACWPDFAELCNSTMSGCQHAGNSYGLDSVWQLDQQRAVLCGSASSHGRVTEIS